MVSFAVPEIDWAVLMPVLTVMATGVVALIIEMMMPRRNNNTVVAVSLIGLCIAAVYALNEVGRPDTFAISGMVQRDHFGTLMQLLLIGVCAVSFLFSEQYLREKRIAFAEFYPLALWSTAGGMVMVSTNNLLMMFLGLEVLSIALYCLAGMSRKEQKSEESALKYFLLGAFASAFFLYGIAFLYGSSGSIDLSAIAAATSMGLDSFDGMVLLGVVLVIVGLGFKTALVPFHQWTPDVYQGAPTNVTAFMSAASKIAAFGALVRVLVAAAPVQEYWFPVLFWMAVLTMVVGNVVAIAQRDVKRILGYSSIGHAGYVLVGVLAHVKAPDKVSLDAVLLYLGIYSLMTLGAFAVVTVVAKGGKEQTRLQDFNGLWQQRPLAAFAMIVCMFSLMGIPPFAGFLGKYYIFVGAVSADLHALAYVLALSSAVSVYYYWAIARACWIEEEGITPMEKAKVSPGLAMACIVCVAGLLGAMVFANPVMKFIKKPVVIDSAPIEQPVGQVAQSQPTQ
jgi:NADH-quinone oxidoreductase subunit N